MPPRQILSEADLASRWGMSPNGDMAWAKAEASVQRNYSMSAQIQCERKTYYDHLEATQKGSMGVTDGLEWFLACLLRCLLGAEQTLAAVLMKARYWRHWAGKPMNQRQIKLLNKILDRLDSKPYPIF